jgi:hypothetical protein
VTQKDTVYMPITNTKIIYGPFGSRDASLMATELGERFYDACYLYNAPTRILTPMEFVGAEDLQLLIRVTGTVVSPKDFYIFVANTSKKAYSWARTQPHITITFARMLSQTISTHSDAWLTTGSVEQAAQSIAHSQRLT